MTARSAARITGLDVRRLTGGGNGLCYGLFVNEFSYEPIHSLRGRSPAPILSRLVEWHYSRVRNQVFVEQNWRCFACGLIRPLSCDHIKPRGQGRFDHRLNLRGLCSSCHEDHTLNRPISIHPKMVQIMSKVGLCWIGEWESDLIPWGWGKVEP